MVKYKRPFKATELSDLTLIPKQEYNITSAYGCYLKTDASTEGTDPNALYKDNYGCRGQWQALNAYIVSSWYNKEVGLEFSQSALQQSYDEATGRWGQTVDANVEGLVEDQLTILLLEHAMTLTASIFTLGAFILYN